MKNLSIIILLFLCNASYSQTYDYIPDDNIIPLSSIKNKRYGIDLSGLATGSGLGLNFNPSVIYRYRTNLFAIGPNIQRDNLHFSGLQSFYQRDLTVSYESWVLYCHAILLYHLSASLGPSGMEQHFNFHGTLNDFRYNAIEHYTGFGVKKMIADNIHFDTSIGLGAYYTLNGDKQTAKTPFRSDNDVSLMIKLGLTYDFKR
jgi:hypothetical protein